MNNLKLTRTFTLLIVIGATALAASAAIARENRKKSAPASAPRSSASGHGTGASSPRAAPPSRPSISSRPAPGSSSRAPQTTTRQSRRIAPSRGTASGTREIGGVSAPRAPRSGLNVSGPGSSSGRISRKYDVAPSYPSPVAGSSRVDRKYDGYPGYPPTRRSLYHYHRDYYPSHRIFYWITWPNCCRPICYTWGPDFTFGFFWPYYHRKFIFISLGGYWPDYDYRRYYWYGWHPYTWYGYYPPGYVVAGPTYNYYYYNEVPQGGALAQAQQRLEEQPPAEPAPETQADRYFDQAVKAFEAADYAAATQKFHDAMQVAPEDVVLPFAYAQAFFANGDYQQAAEILRGALMTASAEKEGVFYPRGLYSDESILQKQVQQLAQAVEQDTLNADLKLLLGYQLLGLGRFDEAAAHLQHARLDANNSHAATTLINLLEKLQKPDKGSPPAAEQQEPPAATSQPQNAQVR